MKDRHAMIPTTISCAASRRWRVLFCLLLLGGAGGRLLAGWEQVDGILARIQAPRFPDRDFAVTDYGAVADGQTDCTGAFSSAIAAAHKAGGGRVIVPPGTFCCGPIHLKSNVNLHLSKGAVIQFSVDPNAYLPVVYTRFEGVECLARSPLVYACEQENIAITGEGTLDGQASDENWWRWKRTQGDDVEALRNQGESAVPVRQRVYGRDAKLRPNMIQPYKCRNILIEGVTIRNSPMWHIHPVLSSNITVRNVRIVGHGPNNDGCNPESCRDVLIEGCYFDTGDDCIAIKSGRNNDGRRVNVPTENVVIRNCEMSDGHGGVVIGSEMTGGARNIFAENCTMDSPNLDRALRIKTNSVRGGTVENVYLRDITVGQVAEAVVKINFLYGEGDVGDYTPTVRNIFLERVTSRKSKYALSISGYDRSPITNVHLANCTFENVDKPNRLVGVEGLVWDNVTINGKPVRSTK